MEEAKVKIYKSGGGGKKTVKYLQTTVAAKNVQRAYPEQDEMGEACFMQGIQFTVKHIH